MASIVPLFDNKILPDGLSEQNFWIQVTVALMKALGNKRQHNKWSLLYYTSEMGTDRESAMVEMVSKLKGEGRLVAAIHIANEVNYDPQYYNIFDAIFRTYCSERFDDSDRIFSLPIGWCCAPLAPEEKEGVDDRGIVPFRERSIDVFFAGQTGQTWTEKAKTARRTAMLKRVNSLDDCSTIVVDNASFKGGMAADIYRECMQQAKICLVPHGFSPETYRLTEALQEGCIVVTDVSKEEIPAAWYAKAPVVLVRPDWSDFNSLMVKRLLEDAEERCSASLNYYNRWLAPEAVARQILEKLQGLS
jgi:hypothetical protein